MSFRLKADGATGVVAVYDYTAGDDNPFTTPLSNVSRLKFHSALPAVGVVSVVTGSLTLSALAANNNDYRSYTLFAHGQSGIPYIEGRITAIGGSGVSRGFNGSVIVQQQSGGTNPVSSFARWVHIGADATNVYLNEVISTHVSTVMSSLALSYEIYITDYTFS
ncbi:MAG: hypothetical protein AB7O13_24745 [Alphaproteobacteria bacterium]